MLLTLVPDPLRQAVGARGRGESSFELSFSYCAPTDVLPSGVGQHVFSRYQIQALDRTQPGLPMKKGRCGTMTHDYKRNGTTTLFAALNMLDGTVIGECMPRHRHREFLRFLKTIDQRTLPNLDLHLIVDNYATHKTPAVKRWLKRHTRFHLHFTPTSGSWLNMVERFFAEITRKRIRRGGFKGVDELKQAIMDYLDNHNGHPKPYIWTKTATEIFSKVARAKQVLESQHEDAAKAHTCRDSMINLGQSQLRLRSYRSIFGWNVSGSGKLTQSATRI